MDSNYEISSGLVWAMIVPDSTMPWHVVVSPIANHLSQRLPVMPSET